MTTFFRHIDTQEYQKNMKILKLNALSIIALTLLSCATAFAQTGGGKSVRVKFAKGASSAVYTGTVSHSSDAYFLSARRGQIITIKIGGSGDPAFHLGKVPKGSKDAADYESINGEDLKSLTYKINTDDDLAILVGAIRGSSSYKLTITIK
jgi:hypothetical protein